MRRSGIGPGARSLERGSTFKPSRRRTKGDKDREGHHAFAQGREKARCVVCGAKGCTPHHIVTEQRCRRAARWLGVPEHRLAWDKRNRLWLCRRHHEAHHSRARPISWQVLERHARKVFQFAREIGETPYLERMYPQHPTNEGE